MKTIAVGIGSDKLGKITVKGRLQSRNGHDL